MVRLFNFEQYFLQYIVILIFKLKIFCFQESDHFLVLCEFAILLSVYMYV